MVYPDITNIGKIFTMIKLMDDFKVKSKDAEN